MPVCHAQHTVRACACARHTLPRAHAVHPERGVHAAISVALQGQRIATPGATTPALQTAQPTPGAPHPIGPSSSPSVRSDLCVAARSPVRTHFLAVTGSSFTRPAQRGPGQAQKSDAAVRRPDRVCPVCPLVLLPPWVTGRQCARAAVTLCTGSRRAPIRGTPSLALRSARRRSASRAEISRTHYWPRSTAQRRRSRRPRTL